MTIIVGEIYRVVRNSHRDQNQATGQQNGTPDSYLGPFIHGDIVRTEASSSNRDEYTMCIKLDKSRHSLCWNDCLEKL